VTPARSNTFHVSAEYQPLVREIGIDADAIFERADIKPWRRLGDRENCVLDADGVRLHVKRFPATAKGTPAEEEVRGIQLLQRAGIATVPLVGWGAMADGRSFIVTLDLEGYRDAEKCVAAGASFQEMLEPTARLSAQLHNAGLHHRDLYLCHFFARFQSGRTPDVALIDAARVRPLPRWFRNRWVVKDLAQFWYSTTKLPAITNAQRDAWLQHYATCRVLTSLSAMRRAIERKVGLISRHDRKLNTQQPTRNISIPARGE
jgi:hypothetical protein